MAGNKEVTDLSLVPSPTGGDMYIAKTGLDYRIRTGEANGLATLDSSATVAAAQIPGLAASKITSGILTAIRGGTGIGSYTTGNYIRAATTTSLEQRTPAQVLTDIGGLASSSYTASDVLTKIKTVDGTGSGLDADLLDGQEGSFYLPASSYTAADVLVKIKTVDGVGSGLDADLLDGQSGAYYTSWSNFTGTPTTLAGYGITDGASTSNVVLKAGDTMTGGLSFGSAVAPGGVNDLSRHIMLHTGGYGFNVTSSRLNYNVPSTANHSFYSGTTINLSVGDSTFTYKGNEVYHAGNFTPASKAEVTANDDVKGASTGSAFLKRSLTGDQTAGSPQYTWIGNEGTGMRRASSNVIEFDAAGVARARISATGLDVLSGTLSQGGSAVALDSSVVHLAGTETVTGSKTFTNGISTGSSVAASATDFTKHIALFGTTYGFTITSGTLNLVAASTVHPFTASGYVSPGTIKGRMETTTRNAATTLSATYLNAVVEKSNTTAYTYTLGTGFGSQGDAITIVNSGTAGDVTVARSGTALYKNGVDADLTVGPGSMVTIYRSATANRWIA